MAKDGKVESNDRRPSFVFDFARKLFAEHLGEKRLVVGLRFEDVFFRQSTVVERKEE